MQQTAFDDVEPGIGVVAGQLCDEVLGGGEVARADDRGSGGADDPADFL